MKMLLFLFSSLLFQLTLSEFTFSPVLLAHKPKGFTVYIEDQPDIKEFRFVGRINNAKTLFGWATKKDEEGKWKYYNRFAQLNLGDEITYEATVWKRDKSEYNINETWTALYFIPSDGKCLESTTFVSGIDTSPCSGNLLFEDDFLESNLNTTLWTIEQYIPQYTEENFEFVSYENLNDCKFISNSRLFLKPVIRNDEELYGTLDLRQGCTRSAPEACYHKQVGPYIIPPIKSAKIISKVSFKYGRVEIGAKLPVGDWIYPQIELTPKQISKKYPKFLIAFARGNTKLTLDTGDDISCNSLFGGYMSDSKEPERSMYLKKKTVPDPDGDIKVFSVIWTPDKLYLIYGKELYGKIKLTSDLGEYRISLGVGVGGNFDFPDRVKSGSVAKPWRNNDAKQAKKFINAKNQWSNTWQENNVALQIDYVRVYAL